MAFALPAAFLACLSILAGRMLLPTSRTSNKQQHADMRIVPTYFRPSCASLQLPLQVAVEREVVRYMSGDSSIRQQAAAALLPRCSSFAAVAVAAWLCCVSLLLLLLQPHGCPSSPQQQFWSSLLLPVCVRCLPCSWSVGLAQFPHPSAKSPSLIGQFAPTFLFASIMFQVGLLSSMVVVVVVVQRTHGVVGSGRSAVCRHCCPRPSSGNPES